MIATPRRHFVWKLAGRELLLGERTLLMGVLNVTPDSFTDGGKYLDPDRAFARAIELECLPQKPRRKPHAADSPQRGHANRVIERAIGRIVVHELFR